MSLQPSTNRYPTPRVTLLVLLCTTVALLGCAPQPSPTAVSTPTPTGVPTQPTTATPTPSPVQPTSAPTALPATPENVPASLVPTQTPTAAATPPPAATEPASGFDLTTLQAVMLAAVNADRAAAGLTPVAWDDTAAQAGQAHAADMLALDYFSHWNLQGLGPEHRYALAGGLDAVAENLYTFWYRYEDGRAAPIDDWSKVIREAQTSLMKSPGHRRTILQPSHTHLGIGVAYDPQRGEMRLAQEFVTRLVDIDPPPDDVQSGDTVMVQGTLDATAQDPLINLTYSPPPVPYTTETVPGGTYSAQAEIIEAIQPDMDGNRFSAEVHLGEPNTPGIYSIRTWVRQGEEMVLASELVVFAR